MQRQVCCCPVCGDSNTNVTCLRINKDKSLIRRYRKCNKCSHKFRTTQPAEIYDDEGEVWGTWRVEPGAHHAKIFTDAQIAQLRKMFESGEWTRDELSVMFDANYSYVCRIINKKVRA